MPRIQSIKHFIENPKRSCQSLSYRAREFWRWKTATIKDNPIFILGNQKAGTSVITALLGEAIGLSYTIDIFCLYQGLEEALLRGDVSFEDVIERGRYYFSKDIIKDPSFTFFYDEISTYFPSSKRVFVLRDPRQNIRSILNRLQLPGDMDDLSPSQWEMLKQNFPSWYLVLDGSLAGHKGKTYIETLALRCGKALQLYSQHKEDIIPIYYEKFNQDKIGAIQALSRQLGFDIKHPIELLKDKQFQPRGDKDISMDSFFGASNLERIETICGESMLAVGYEL